MKTFTVSAALALMATLAHAAPAPGSPEARQFEVQLTFEGAGPNPPTYTLSEPTDGSVFYISKMFRTYHKIGTSRLPLLYVVLRNTLLHCYLVQKDV